MAAEGEILDLTECCHGITYKCCCYTQAREETQFQFSNELMICRAWVECTCEL